MHTSSASPMQPTSTTVIGGRRRSTVNEGERSNVATQGTASTKATANGRSTKRIAVRRGFGGDAAIPALLSAATLFTAGGSLCASGSRGKGSDARFGTALSAYSAEDDDSEAVTRRERYYNMLQEHRRQTLAAANSTSSPTSTNGKSKNRQQASSPSVPPPASASSPTTTTTTADNNTNSNNSSEAFTEAQLAEIEDAFNVFNFHTHNGLMRGDDLSIALHVLGLEISRDQHRGYVALYSTSATNARERLAAASLDADELDGGEGRRQSQGVTEPLATDPQALIAKMANLKASRNYFTMSDFVEICEDARDARLRSGLPVGAMGTANRSPAAIASKTSSSGDWQQQHTKQWISNSFNSFNEASISAATMQRTLRGLLASIHSDDGHGDVPTITADNDDEGDAARRTAPASPNQYQRKKNPHAPLSVVGGGAADEDPSGLLGVARSIPSLDEVAATFRDLGLDAHMGVTCEELLRVLGQSTTIL